MLECITAMSYSQPRLVWLPSSPSTCRAEVRRRVAEKFARKAVDCLTTQELTQLIYFLESPMSQTSRQKGIKSLKNKNDFTGFSVSLVFPISQHIRDENLLTTFIEYLGCGRVKIANKANIIHHNVK